MRTLLFIFLFLTVPGCISFAPHSNSFKPAGAIEKEYFDLSDASIFPNDIKADLKKYKDKTVSWVGVVDSVKLDEPMNQPEYGFWLIAAQHHYYDWIVDHGLQAERFFLSPDGEGPFYVVVPVKRYLTHERNQRIKEIESRLKLEPRRHLSVKI